MPCTLEKQRSIIIIPQASAHPAPEPQLSQYFQNSLGLLTNLAGNIVGSTQTSLGNLVNGTANILENLAGTIANTISPLAGVPEDVIVTALGLLSAKTDLITETLEDIYTGLGNIANSVPSLSNLANGIQTTLESLPAQLSAYIGTPLLNILQTLADAATNPDLSAIVGPITNAVQNALAPLAGFADLTNIRESLNSIATTLANAISQFYSTAFANIPNISASNLIVQLGNFFKNIASGISQFVRDFGLQVQQIQKALSDLAKGIAADIKNAATSAYQFIRDSANNALAALQTTFDSALSRLSVLQNAATAALNSAKSLIGTFNTTLNAFGLQARALQTDLTNFLTSLGTAASNANTQIQAAANNIAAAINASIANANNQLTNLYESLEEDITDAINSGNAKAVACANAAKDAVVANTQTAANAIAACNTNAQATLDGAVNGALTGLATQFNLASTANAKIADCITAYQANGSPTTGAACLVSVGVNALKTSTSAAINTIVTGFTGTAQSIASGAQTCASTAITAAQAQATATNNAFQQCLAA